MGDRSAPLSQRFSIPERLSAFRPQRLKRAARALAKWGAIGATFAAGLGGGVLLHLDSELGRRAARVIANAVLAPVFDGRIEVGEIEQLGLQHARVKHAKIYDPSGRHVIEAEGIEAEVGTLALLSSLLSGDGLVTLELPVARIERAHVSLREGQAGVPTIAGTFLPADKTPSLPGGRPFLLEIRDVYIAEAEVVSELAAPFAARLHDLRGQVTVRGDRLVAVDVQGVAISTDDLIPAPLSGVVDYHLRVDVRSDAWFDAAGVGRGPQVVMWADLQGTLGELPVSASGVLEGVRLDAEASFPMVAPAALKALIPGLPLEVPVRARARIAGSLPSSLRAHVRASLGDDASGATLVADAGVSFADELRVEVGADVSQLDPRMLLRSLPEARVDGRAKAGLVLPNGEATPAFSAELSTAPTFALGQQIPAIDALVDVHRGEVLVTTSLREPGVVVDAKARLSDGHVAFSADLLSDDLTDSPRLAGRLRGAARARVDGKFADGELEAKLSATVRQLATTSPRDPQVGLDRGTLVATVHGPLLGLSVDAHASGSGVRAAGEQLDAVDATAKGSLLSPHLTLDVKDRERGTLRAAGDASLAAREIRGVTFDLERGGESAKGSVAVIDLGAGLAVRGVAVRAGSIGTLSGSLSFAGGDLLGDLSARGLDLQRLNQLLDLGVPMAGVANLDARLERTAAGRRGSLELELADARVLLVDGIAARVSARFDGEQVEASGFVRVVDRGGELDTRGPEGLEREAPLWCDGPIAELRVANVLGQLRGPLLSAATWRAATGSADVALDHVDLGCIERRVPSFLWPFARARGKVTLQARVAREPGDREPSIIDLVATTVGLDLDGKGSRWSSSQLDLALRGGYDGKEGRIGVDAAAYRQGTNDVLVRLGAELVDHVGDLLGAAPGGVPAILSAPIRGSLEVPLRPVDGFAALPSPLADWLPELDGALRATASLGGTLARPTAELRIEGKGLLPRTLAARADWVPPLSLQLISSYDPSRSDAELRADLKLTTAAEVAMTAVARVSLPAASLFAAAPLPWTASLEANLNGLRLESIPTLADRGLSGQLLGRVAVHGLNRAPWASLNLTSLGLVSQDHDVKLKLDASIDEEGVADLGLRLFDDPRREGGAVEASGGGASALFKRLGPPRLEVIGTSQLRWAGRALPVFEPSQPGSLEVYAQQFEIGTLYPLVSGVLSRLEGTLSGSARLSWQDLRRPESARFSLFEERCQRPSGESTPAERHACASDAQRVEVPAALELRDVIAYIPSLGQELHHGHATVALQDLPSGEQRLTLEGFEVLGSSGRVVGGARAGAGELGEGGAPYALLRGLRPVKAAGSLTIPEDEPLPITFEGVSFGKASGRVDFELVPTLDAMRTALTISDASFELPTSSSRALQSMDPARGVRVRGEIGPPAEQRSAAATRWELAVDLRPTKIKSSALEVTVKSEGPLQLVLTDQLEASGDVSLVQGSVVVNKKKFEIDRGLVRLRREEPGNPYVNLTAHWEAGADLRVFVDYQGLLSPITDDKIRFRADPPMPKDEITQMLLLGQSTAVNAVNLVGTVGGTVATSFANDLLSAATGSFFQQLTVSIGSSDSESSIGASWHGSDKVTVGAGFRQLEETADRASTARCGDVYLEWRVSDRWSLRGSSGYCAEEEAASAQDGISVGIDALWQYRY